MNDLGDPPRQLAPHIRRLIWLGSPILTLSLLNTILVLLSLVTLILIYDVGLQNILLVRAPQVVVDSQISQVDWEFLESGGRVRVAYAQVKVNNETITAKGYGPLVEWASVGAAVQIVVPKEQAHSAWLKGFWPKPTTLGLLFQFAMLFAVPAIMGFACSVWRSTRKLKLLTQGTAQSGQKVKSFPLPRPLKDHRLVRYSYSLDQNRQKRFWSLQKTDESDDTLLVCEGAGAAPVNRIVSDLKVTGNVLDGGNRRMTYLAHANVLLLVLHVLLLFSLLFT